MSRFDREMYRTARKELVQVPSLNAHQVCDSDNEPQDQTSILVGPRARVYGYCSGSL